MSLQVDLEYLAEQVLEQHFFAFERVVVSISDLHHRHCAVIGT
jgi:hypothetical protein